MKNKIKCLYLYCCFIILFPSFSIAQYDFHFTHYTNNNGLPPGSFHHLVKGPRGHLWLLAENGVSRFNGYDFETYHYNPHDSTSIFPGNVRNSYFDSSSNFYFSSKNSLVTYNYKNESFDKLLEFSKPGDLAFFVSSKTSSYALVNNLFYTFNSNAVLQSKVILNSIALNEPPLTYFQSGNLIYLLTKKQFFIIDLPKASVVKSIPISVLGQQSIIFQNNDRELFISTTKQLLKYNAINNSFISLPIRPSENSHARLVPHFKLRIANAIYVSNQLGQIYKLDLFTGTVDSLDLTHLLKSKSNTTIQLYNLSAGVNNNLWVESDGGGLIEIDITDFRKGLIRRVHTGNSNIPTNNCNNILDDTDGLIWILSTGKGLIKGEKIKSNFKTFYPGEKSFQVSNLIKNVRSIQEISYNTLAIATLSGTYLYTLENIHTSNFITDEATERIIYNFPTGDLLLDNQKSLWISGWNWGELMNYNFNNNQNTSIIEKIKPRETSLSLRATLLDKNTIYFGTNNNSLFKKEIDPIRLSTVVPPVEIAIKRKKESASPGIIFCLKKYGKYHILVGSQNGLFLYNTQNDSLTIFKSDNPQFDVLYTSDIRSIFVRDSGDFWVGTNGIGLFHVNLLNNDIKNYTNENGLSDNSVYTILVDKQGKLWLGTNTGLNRFDPIKENFSVFSGKDGIGFEEFNTNAACQLSDGRMVFGGIGGFVIFHPDSIKSSNTPLELYLNKVLINNELTNNSSNYTLKHNQNYLTFQFSALTFFRNEDIKYAYKMEGLDNNWIYCGSRRFTTYANLEPGSYTFMVKCTNPDGLWNEKLLRVEIIIKNPWYKTWYAITAYFFILFGLIYFVNTYRLKQRLKLQSIRDNIARDLHDEIGSNLSSISIFSEVAKESAIKQSVNLVSVLNKISEYTQISQEAMNDIVWMIDSKNERFENIFTKMRTYAAETIGSGHYNLILNFDSSIGELKLPIAKRKNFYLIFKEAINNLLKYAQCDKVEIDVRKENNLIHLSISDNGIGFLAANSRGNGLHNMKKRAEELNGTLEIDSEIGKGTRITLKFQL